MLESTKQRQIHGAALPPSPHPLTILLSIEWTAIRLGSPAHGIVAKTVHKTLPGSPSISLRAIHTK